LKPSRRNTRKQKQQRGDERVVAKKPSMQQDYNLGWFKPKGKQQDIQNAMETKELIIVNSPSGTGKSSTIIHKALCDYKRGRFNKILLIKTPAESGTDQLGFLTGNKNEKLLSHMESMKSIFLQFMTKNKLENDIASGNLIFDVPNYLQGRTIDNAIIILEEAQVMNPDTIKLCAERAGKGSIVVVAGDSDQRYAIKKREDGLLDLIDRVCYENYNALFPMKPEFVAYIEMDSSHNMRSSLSRYVTEIYAE
jgi:predicted ribonuclease YlaK